MDPEEDEQMPEINTPFCTSIFEVGSCSKQAPNTRIIDTDSDDDSSSVMEDSFVEGTEELLSNENEQLQQISPTTYNYMSLDMKRLRRKGTRG